MSGLGLSVDLERSEISSNLNASTLFVFLTGMYTIIYFGTIYLYFTKNSSKCLLIPAVLTLLYLSTVVQTGVQWYAIKWDFVNNGDTRDSMFLGTFEGPHWMFVTCDSAEFVTFVLADGLLIWRAFFVWNRSLRVMLLPFIFIIAETALFLVEIVAHAIFTNTTISWALAVKLNDVLAAAYFTSAATTVLTTTLIAYRIYSASKLEGLSTKRFSHIVDIVVQSGAIYALSSVTNAISQVGPGAGNILNTRATALAFFIPSITVSISGISATIMVARVALYTANPTFPSTSGHISGLRFHAPSTQQTDILEGMNGTRSVAGDRLPAAEAQIVEGKA